MDLEPSLIRRRRPRAGGAVAERLDPRRAEDGARHVGDARRERHLHQHLRAAAAAVHPAARPVADRGRHDRGGHPDRRVDRAARLRAARRPLAAEGAGRRRAAGRRLGDEPGGPGDVAPDARRDPRRRIAGERGVSPDGGGHRQSRRRRAARHRDVGARDGRRDGQRDRADAVRAVRAVRRRQVDAAAGRSRARPAGVDPAADSRRAAVARARAVRLRRASAVRAGRSRCSGRRWSSGRSSRSATRRSCRCC